MTAAKQQAPRERPILFSAPMVRAILAGTKTQTRRPVRFADGGAAHHAREDATWRIASDGLWHPCVSTPGREAWGFTPLGSGLACPYGAPGDRLWVRETWAYPWHHAQPRALYRADDNGDENDTALGDGFDRWRPSIHMPRWASRIDLEVTEVRVQRIQDISEEDARAEGVAPGREDGDWIDYLDASVYAPSARDSFRTLWDSINGPRGYGWDANPWVWAISFKRVRP